MPALDSRPHARLRDDEKRVRDRILLVDDDPEIHRLVARVLRGDYDVATAASGAEALPLLSGQSWGLLILDIGLPGISGLDILRAVRRAQPELRVLMLTASTDLDQVKTALDRGVQAYMTKPFVCEELEETVRCLLNPDESGPGGGRPWRVAP